MAFILFAGNIWRGLSTDTKPNATTYAGNLLVENDSGKYFHATGGAWVRLDALGTDTTVAGHAAETGQSSTHTHPGGSGDMTKAVYDPAAKNAQLAAVTDLHTAFVQADHDALANPHHSNANDHAATNDPSADQKAALAGTSGTPSVTNKYVTDADARNTNARTPSSTLTHGDAAHNALTYEASGAVTTHVGAADPHTGYQKESEKSAEFPEPLRFRESLRAIPASRRAKSLCSIVGMMLPLANLARIPISNHNSSITWVLG